MPTGSVMIGQQVARYDHGIFLPTAAAWGPSSTQIVNMRDQKRVQGGVLTVRESKGGFTLHSTRQHDTTLTRYLVSDWPISYSVRKMCRTFCALSN